MDDKDSPEFVSIDSYLRYVFTIGARQTKMRKAYDFNSIGWVKEKSHERAPVLTRMGTSIDGIVGWISNDESKLRELISLTF